VSNPYSVTGAVTGAALSSVGLLADVAESSPTATGTAAVFAGAAMAWAAVAIGLWRQVAQARREELAKDKVSKLEIESREYDTWGSRIDKEKSARMRAEAVHEADLLEMERLKLQIKTLEAAVRRSNDRIEREVVPAVNRASDAADKVSKRVDAVEADQARRSGDSIPVAKGD